jgi:predicted RNA-binding protein with PIN domain
MIGWTIIKRAACSFSSLLGRIGQGIERYSTRRMINMVESHSAEIEQAMQRAQAALKRQGTGNGNRSY